MDTVPQEILDKISSNLSIGDAQRAHDAVPDISVERRTDPVVYLGQAFEHPRFLMACMTDSGCILGGSRALEYFEPGSAADKSGWDFFIRSDLETVRIMMSALEHSGVTWDLDTQKFSRLLNGDAGHCEMIPLAEVCRAHRYSKRGSEPTCFKELDKDIAEDIPVKNLVTHIYDMCRDTRDTGTPFDHILIRNPDTMVKVTKTSSGCSAIIMHSCIEVDVIASSRDDSAHNSSSFFGRQDDTIVVRGHTKTLKGGHAVQLILCSPAGKGFPVLKETPVSRITSSYATHVQCFLSGWCAVQLFPAETSERLSFLWDGERDASVSLAKQKYKERGYRFLDWSEPYAFPSRRMHVDAADTLFVDFAHIYGDTPEELARARGVIDVLKAGLKMISWYVNREGILRMSIDDELMRTTAIGSAPRTFVVDGSIKEALVTEHNEFLSIYNNVEAFRSMLVSGVLRVGSMGKYGLQLL